MPEEISVLAGVTGCALCKIGIKLSGVSALAVAVDLTAQGVVRI